MTWRDWALIGLDFVIMVGPIISALGLMFECGRRAERRAMAAEYRRSIDLSYLNHSMQLVNIKQQLQWREGPPS